MKLRHSFLILSWLSCVQGPTSFSEKPKAGPPSQIPGVAASLSYSSSITPVASGTFPPTRQELCFLTCLQSVPIQRVQAFIPNWKDLLCSWMIGHTVREWSHLSDSTHSKFWFVPLKLFSQNKTFTVQLACHASQLESHTRTGKGRLGWEKQASCSW
jgi:hypothetical protein